MDVRNLVLLLGFIVTVQAADSEFSAVACERTFITLACPDGKVVKVKRALYGRREPFLCPGVNDQRTHCQSQKAFYIVTAACNGRAACTQFATNSAMAGDPCYNVCKYLQIDYDCVIPTSANRVALVCERQTARLACPYGKRIRVEAALYGRLVPGSRICPGQNTHVVDCRSDKAMTVVNQSCRGRHSCSVPATNGKFKDDPCHGTTKYLRIEYRCI